MTSDGSGLEGSTVDESKHIETYDSYDALVFCGDEIINKVIQLFWCSPLR